MGADRRFLIAIGTEHYKNLGEDARLARVPSEMKTIVNLFTKLGYSLAGGKGHLDLRREELERLVSAWFRDEDRQRSDIAVLYYTGHGVQFDDQYFLLAADSDENNWAASAIIPELLETWLLSGTRPQRLLIILDTCFAGGGIQVFMEKALRQVSKKGGTVVGLAAASHKDYAAQGLFATALAQEIQDRRWGGDHLEYLPLSSVVSGIHNRWVSQGEQQRLFIAIFGAELDAFLPNPRYRPDLPPGVDLAAQSRLAAMTPDELRVHWGPRARGVELPEQSGWLFSGRHAALIHIAEWLESGSAKPNVLWITGGPGSGKSALLARIVTLSDPELRKKTVGLKDVPSQTVPPVNSIDVAIHGRGKTLTEFVERLSTATGITATRPSELLASLSGKRVTIVVDALDEALDAKAIRDELLGPLGTMPDIRLLVGTRRSLLQPKVDEVTLDLDRPEWFTAEDVANYAERILVGADEPERSTPYRNYPKTAAQVSQAIAVKAGHTFLVARLVARSLADQRTRIDTALPDWAEQLPGNFGQAFEEYLRRFARDEQRARDLLKPLAYAEGAGFPWETLWATTASAMGGTVYVDTDVDWLLRNAADYIVEEIEAGRSVYRLYHEQFAEHLRGHDGDSRKKDEADLTRGLLASIPRGTQGESDWPRAHPYIKRHLATHASYAGLLDTLLLEPMFLVVADPERLLRLLHHAKSKGAQDAVRVYQQTSYIARSSQPPEALSYLELNAMRLGVPWPPIAGLDRRLWHPLWTPPRPTTDHYVIGQHDDEVTCIALGMIEGQPVIVSGSKDTMVRVWDLSTGEPRGAPLTGHRGPVTSVALGTLDGQSVIVSGSSDKTVRVWDLTTGRPFGTPLIGHTATVRSVAVATVDGQSLIVSGGEDSTVRVWDLAARQPRGGPLEVKVGTGGAHVFSVAVATLGGRSVIVSATAGQRLWIWDLATRKPYCRPRRIGNDHIVLGTLNGRPVIVTGGYEPGWVSDLGTGEPLGGPLQNFVGYASSIAVGTLDGQPIVVTAGDDATLRLWDLATGQPRGRPLEGHVDRAESVAITTVDDETVIVSGGSDRTVRVWRVGVALGQPSLAAQGESRVASTTTIAIGALQDRSVVVTGGSGNKVWAWDLSTGALHGPPFTCHTSSIGSLALGRVDGQEVVVTGGGDRTVRLWDLASGQPLGEPLRVDFDIQCVAWNSLNDRPVIVVGGYPQALCTWYLPRGKRRWKLLWPRSRWIDRFRKNFGLGRQRQSIYGDAVWGYAHRVTSIAIGTRANEPIIMSGNDDGIVRLWDLATGLPRWPPLAGKSGWVTSVSLGTLNGQPVVVSGSTDKTVRVWDLTTSRPLWSLEGHSDSVNSVAATTVDGQLLIVSGSSDHTVRVWGERNFMIDVGSAVSAVAIESEKVVVGMRAGMMVFALGE